MLGFGYGGRSPLRYVRLGLLLLVVLAGVAFHGHGSAYHAIHDVYLVAIIGLIGFAVIRGGARRRGIGGGPMGPGPAGPGQQSPPVGGYGAPPGWPSPAPQPEQQISQLSSLPPGWYMDGSPDHERYWDGQAWGARRHRRDGDWVVE